MAGIVLSSLPLYSQEEMEQKSHFFISPEFGLIVGNYTRIEAAPAFGYYPSERLGLAAGFRYEYYKKSYIDNFSTHIIGPVAFIDYIVIKNLAEMVPVQQGTEITAHIEYEGLSLEKKYFSFPSTIEDGRFWYHAVLAGPGISQRVSMRVKANALILWDLNITASSPYSNPVVRFGISITL